MNPIVGALIGPITGLLEKVVPDLDKRKELAHEIATLAEKQAHSQIMAQIQVNKQEAAHKSLFVAGWRPSVGWVCCTALASNYIIFPLLKAAGVDVAALDLATMLPILLGMLGLGGMRTYEKRTGVAREV